MSLARPGMAFGLRRRYASATPWMVHRYAVKVSYMDQCTIGAFGLGIRKITGM
jgi:hypothetical protein